MPERVRAARTRTTSVLLVALVLLVACRFDDEQAAGNAERGARLFSNLPCSGCHGTMAQGQFGPTLAGTGLSYDEVRRQVRTPRDQMPAFSPEQVSDQELRDIYAWLKRLAPPTPTPLATLPPTEATLQALNSFYAEMKAEELMGRMDALDEAALRVSGTVVSVKEEGRYTRIRLRVTGSDQAVDVVGLFDTGLQRRPFPAAAGDRVTVYGIGADPVEVVEDDGSVKEAPQLQILHVRDGRPGKDEGN